MTHNILTDLKVYFYKYLQTLVTEADSFSRMSDRDWTDLVILNFWARLGLQAGYHLTRTIEDHTFKLCFVDRSIPGCNSPYLALECQWGTTQKKHDEDFDDLIAVEAPAKVFVCQCPKGTSKDEAKRLSKKVCEARKRASGGAYLLVMHEDLGGAGATREEGVYGFLLDQDGRLLWESPLERFEYQR